MKMPPKFNANKKLTETFYTLLIDGNSLLKVGYHGAIKEVNWRGENIGGIYQFIHTLRKFLINDLYHRVLVLWDGNNSGKLRYEIFEDYKKTRGKNYANDNVYYYDNDIDVDFLKQKIRIKQYLEDLYIRQYEDEYVEADDLIAYYCLHKGEHEKITICTIDQDLLQLLSDDIQIYLLTKKEMITKDNFNNHYSYKFENILTIKILIGDNSDNIYGIKGLGLKKLLNLFPVLNEKPVTVNEIRDLAKQMQEERIKSNQKPLTVLDNIINGNSKKLVGEDFYLTNSRIINLKSPIINQKCISDLNNLLNLPLNPEGRDFKNVYKYIKEDCITRLIGTNLLSEYLLPFKRLSYREKEYFNQLNN